MSAAAAPFRALLRLELADALRSRWVAFTASTYAAVFGLFVWLGLRESSVLGFTGISRVVLNLSNALVIVIPLVSLVATCQAVVRARTSGFFELFLTQPCRETDWYRAALAARVLVIVGPLAVLLVGALTYGAASHETQVLPLALRSLLVAASLTWAFVGIGFFLSSWAATVERAIVFAVVAWLLASALHDFALIGVLLQLRLSPAAVFALAAANPVEAARLAILSGIDSELSVLGPVGFWLANTLGPRVTLLLGVVWPACVGTLAAWAGARRLRRTDLVA